MKVTHQCDLGVSIPGELSCFETEWEYPELIHLVQELKDISDYLDGLVCRSMHPPSQF